MCCQLLRDGADVLGRGYHQQHVLQRYLTQIPRCAQASIKRHAGQERRIAVLYIDLLDDFALTGPQHHVAAGLPQGLPECGSPRAATDDAEAVVGHALPPLLCGACHRRRRFCSSDRAAGGPLAIALVLPPDQSLRDAACDLSSENFRLAPEATPSNAHAGGVSPPAAPVLKAPRSS